MEEKKYFVQIINKSNSDLFEKKFKQIYIFKNGFRPLIRSYKELPITKILKYGSDSYRQMVKYFNEERNGSRPFEKCLVQLVCFTFKNGRLTKREYLDVFEH